MVDHIALEWPQIGTSRDFNFEKFAHLYQALHWGVDTFQSSWIRPRTPHLYLHHHPHLTERSRRSLQFEKGALAELRYKPKP